MKKLVYLLCALSMLYACGKKEEQKAENADFITATSSKTVQSGTHTSKNTAKVTINPDKFLHEFSQYTDVQKYYFCAAFAMGAMSVSKPVTASAMVNYFMGLGVAKYKIGINDDTYQAFNAGKNSFTSEVLVNTILQKHICEEIMNNAADFAKKKNYNVAELDKLGKIETARVVDYIKKQNK